MTPKHVYMAPSRRLGHTVASRDAVLEVLRRRPCTVGDLAVALGTPSSAIVKALQPLLARHAVMVRICGRRVFYSVDEGVNP